jgi:glycerol-3-phosphate acyltransferase PlsY
VATSAGVMAALVPLALVIALAVWGAVFALGRYVSLASICAAIALPLATAFTTHGDLALTSLTTLIGGLAVWRHKVNIQRLLAGTEHRFGKPAPPVP